MLLIKISCELRQILQISFENGVVSEKKVFTQIVWERGDSPPKKRFPAQFHLCSKIFRSEIC